MAAALECERVDYFASGNVRQWYRAR